MSIEPTVARSLWYRVAVGDIVPSHGDAPCAAILAGVISGDRVNLAVFGADGSGPYAKQNVYLQQEGDPAPGACCWMPYQKGQAAKTEELAKLTAHVPRSDSHTEPEKHKPDAVLEINGAPTAAQGESVATEPQPANQAEPAAQT